MSSAATAQPHTFVYLEDRLAALGIPFTRFIATAQIGRSTWNDWCAGRTRPRADRWAAAIAAFDTLNAEANAPQLDGAKPVVLTGSSAPTGQPPNFRPMAALSPSASPEVNPAEMAEIRRDLEDLIAAHAPGLAAEAEAVIVHKAAKACFDAAAPRRPPVLFWRVDDPFHNPRGRERSPSGGWFQFYTEADIEELRGRSGAVHVRVGRGR